MEVKTRHVKTPSLIDNDFFEIVSEEKDVEKMSDDVQIFVRFRPFNAREQKLSSKQHASHPKKTYAFLHSTKSIRVMKPETKSLKAQHRKTLQVRDFTFDHIFDQDTTQSQLYSQVVSPMVTELFKGYNCTVMSYGQTGSGKTYTMMGDHNAQGIIPRMTKEIFQRASEQEEKTMFHMQCSYVQIYLNQVQDLLNPKFTNLKLREITLHSGSKKPVVYIENCTVCTLRTYKEVDKVLRKGNLNRTTASTNMNHQSSRSHSIFIFSIIQTDIQTQTRRNSKLFLVDLAGSELVSRSKVQGKELKEAQHVNKSLSALSNVIRALTERRAHVPYRDSKLTRLLTDSLGGNSKTALILSVSPSVDSLVETYNTLLFGQRVKRIENIAQVNQDLSIPMYKKLVKTLKAKISILNEHVHQTNADNQALQEELQHLKDKFAQYDDQDLVVSESDETFSPTDVEVVYNEHSLLQEQLEKREEKALASEEAVMKKESELNERLEQVNETENELQRVLHVLHEQHERQQQQPGDMIYQTDNLVVCMDNMFVFESMSDVTEDIPPTVDLKLSNS